MPSLLDLSAELKLTIVEHLELDERLENEKNQTREDHEEEENEERTPKSVTDWPILSLSSTCKVFRTLCAPFVFKSLVLVNNDKSAASIQSIANCAYAHLVRKFRFIGRTKPTMSASYDAPADNDFPESVQSLLENLKAFPDLEYLAIKLPGDRDNFELYPDDSIETLEDVLEAEKSEVWRALTRGAYAAIAKNHDHKSLKHLELVDLVGKQVSSWDTDDFQKLLGNLESLKISLMGGDNGAGWCMNTNDWYGNFIGEMSVFFFKYLTNATHFSLVATTAGPVGLDGWRHASVPLDRGVMPKLESLHLKHNFIGSQLNEFISGHADVLKRVHLESCYSGLNCGMAEDAISWADFFSGIVDARPSALASFQVTPVQTAFDGSEYGDTTEEDVASVKKELAANPERHVFAYNVLDDKYGMLFEDYTGRIEAFKAGTDQAAFDRLMAVVASNVDNIGGR